MYQGISHKLYAITYDCVFMFSSDGAVEHAADRECNGGKHWCMRIAQQWPLSHREMPVFMCH